MYITQIGGKVLTLSFSLHQYLCTHNYKVQMWRQSVPYNKHFANMNKKQHFDFFEIIEMILLQYCTVLKSEQRWRPLLQITN